MGKQGKQAAPLAVEAGNTVHLQPSRPLVTVLIDMLKMCLDSPLCCTDVCALELLPQRACCGHEHAM